MQVSIDVEAPLRFPELARQKRSVAYLFLDAVALFQALPDRTI